jgi:hypothetical protein
MEGDLVSCIFTLLVKDAAKPVEEFSIVYIDRLRMRPCHVQVSAIGTAVLKALRSFRQLSAGKIMASLVQGFRRSGLCVTVTVTAQYCSKLLCNDVHQAVQKKRPGRTLKIIVLRMKCLSHTAMG